MWKTALAMTPAVLLSQVGGRHFQIMQFNQMKAIDVACLHMHDCNAK